MRCLALIPPLIAALTLAGAASAQVVQTYTYDGNGRLVAATRTVGGVGTQTTYTLDDVDNRSARTTTSGSFARAAGAPSTRAARSVSRTAQAQSDGPAYAASSAATTAPAASQSQQQSAQSGGN